MPVRVNMGFLLKRTFSEGDDKVVSGFKNKMQVAMSNVMPDTMVADQLKKQQEPVHKSSL